MKKFLCIFILAFILLSGCGLNADVTSESSEVVSEVTADVAGRIKLSFSMDSFLQKLTDQNWQHDSVQTVLGKRDVYFNRYDVYFDQGISVKYSERESYRQEGDEIFIGYFIQPTGNIENILLNKNYKGEIADGVSMKSSKDEIINRLGTPQFIDDTLNSFGYRANGFYLFFTGEDRIDEISVYPVFAEANQAKVLQQVQALCKENGYSRELAEKFAANFTAQFKNYNYYFSLIDQARYSSRAGEVGFASFTSGIEIQWDDRAEQCSPILRIYGNSDLLSSFKDATDITDKDGNALIEYRLTDDLVFIQEQNRIAEKAEAAQRAAEEGVFSPDGNVILVDNRDWASPLVAGFHVLYKDGSKPDFTVLTSPFFGSAAWVNNRYFLCNYSKNSLMIYDLQLKQSKLLSRSMSFCEILPDKITVDDGAGENDVIIRYSFDKDGSIVLSCDNNSFMNLEWDKIDKNEGTELSPAEKYLSSTSDVDLLSEVEKACYIGTGGAMGFAKVSDISSDDLYRFANMTVDLDMLNKWYNSTDQKYHIPLSDITTLLDKYFEGYTFVPNGIKHINYYDEEKREFVAAALGGDMGAWNPFLVSKEAVGEERIEVHLQDQYEPQYDIVITAKVTETGIRFLSCVKQ